MLTREQALDCFLRSCDDLINSKYILADGKISEILKSIAQSRLMYELFEYVTDGFDYAAVKSVCLVKDGKAFALPQKESDAMAFVFLLLMEIDSHKEDIINIAVSYFPRPEGIQASYEAFCEQAIIPFKLLTEKAAARMILGSGKVNDEPPKIEEKTAQKAKSAISDALTATEKEKRRSDETDELAFILGRLSDSVKAKKIDDITIAYIALKYAVKVVKRPKIDLKAIENEISEVEI